MEFLEDRLQRTFLDKLLGKLALASKGGGLESKRVLGLGVEGRVFDHGVDENPHVVLDLERFDGSRLVLFLDLIHTAATSKVRAKVKSMPFRKAAG